MTAPQVILRMLEAGLLTHISQARLRGFRELIATGALKVRPARSGGLLDRAGVWVVGGPTLKLRRR